MFSKLLVTEATQLLFLLEKHGMKLATAESCTGGLIAALLTEVPGSSSVVERGFVTYSNEAKTQQLGVPVRLIVQHGAVSAEVALSMAEGALKHSNASISLSVTGIAGPGGGTQAKPVGLVFIAVASKGWKTYVEKCNFKGSRSQVRMSAVKKALLMLKAKSIRSL